MFNFFESKLANIATVFGLAIAGSALAVTVNKLLDIDYRKCDDVLFENVSVYFAMRCTQIEKQNPADFLSAIKEDLYGYIVEMYPEDRHTRYFDLADRVIKEYLNRK